VLSKYAGWVLSRLYNGSWNQEEFHQNFNLTHMNGSWVSWYWRWYRERQAILDLQYKVLLDQYFKAPQGERPELPTKRDFENHLMSLTIHNASSIATRSALEAIRVQEGMPVRRPLEYQSSGPEPDDPKLKEEHWGDFSGGKKRAILDWQRALAGGKASYTAFILDYIQRIQTRSKYSPLQMYEYYMSQYNERKITHIERVLNAGERLCTEARVLLGKIDRR
jgi:hypothetical protein